MNKLTKEDILVLLKIAIGVALIVVAIRFFINFLPLIIILLIILLIYDSVKRKKNNIVKKEDEKRDIKEAQIISEKKNDEE